MTGRSVLREHRTPWNQKAVFVGDEVFLTLPSSPTGTMGCEVVTPDGRQIELDTRRRDTYGADDVCAIVIPSSPGRWSYTWTLPNGREATGTFNVLVRGQRKGSKGKGGKR